MTELKFCYCCRVHHPQAQMRPFATRHGERWPARWAVHRTGSESRNSKGDRPGAKSYDASARQSSPCERGMRPAVAAATTPPGKRRASRLLAGSIGSWIQPA